MRMDFTAAASAHVCLLTCCKGQQVRFTAERDATSGSETSPPWFTAAFSVVRRDGIHHEGFSPRNGPRVYPPAGVCTPVMDKDLLRKAHNL